VRKEGKAGRKSGYPKKGRENQAVFAAEIQFARIGDPRQAGEIGRPANLRAAQSSRSIGLLFKREQSDGSDA
jgi:hypothetical protein